jgi:ubiquinone/menaquinone biosynthesis C-methylase UbiE
MGRKERHEKRSQTYERAAEVLAREGHYAWMASLLPAGGGSLLEVGTGTGQSTLALLDKGWRVVAVDSNEACIEATRERVGKRAALVEGDAMLDAGVWKMLQQKGPFDAVASWLLDAPDRDSVLVYPLADRVLRSGGVLQVVVAAKDPVAEMRRHQQLAGVTSLAFESLDVRGELVSIRSRKA